MIDDLFGLFKTASAAYDAGMRAGRDDLFCLARDGICGVSISHEVKPPDDDLATQGFKTAQECAGKLVRAKELLDTRDELKGVTRQ